MPEKYNDLRFGLFDFQVGDCHDHIPFDPCEYIKSSADAGMQAMIFVCKDATGNAYYETELAKKNSSIKGDYLQQAIDAGKQYGVKIYAYLNVLLDDRTAMKYPQYRMVDSRGKKVIAYDYYKILCPNSPYYETVLNRHAEITEKYDIDGIFLDITYFQPDTCYCRYCMKKFQDEYGYPLKPDIELGTKQYRNFCKFKRNTRFNLIKGILDVIKGKKDIPVIWNGSGNFYLSEIEIDEYSPILTSEFHAPNYLDGIVRAKWMHSRNKSFTMTTPYELGSWGDWTVNPESTMKAVFSAIVSNGGGISANHVPYPSGEFASSINKTVLEYIKRNYRTIETMEPWLKDAQSVADIAIMHSVKTKRLLEWISSDMNLSHYYDSIHGAAKMLLEGSRHFDIIEEDTFVKRAKEYKVIILPNLLCMQDETYEKITEFVQNGGTVVATNMTSLYSEDGKKKENFTLSGLFGVDYEGTSDFSVDYMYDLHAGISSGMPDMPILVNKSGSKAIKVLPKENVLNISTLVEPLFESSLDRHVYHQHAHPARRSGHPSVTINENGKGKCVYIAPGIFSSYVKTGSPWLKKLFLNILDHVYNRSVIKTDAPSSVHISLMKQDGKYILHLVNVNDAKYDVTPSFMERMIPVHNIQVEFGMPVKKVYSVPDMEELDFVNNEYGIQFIVPQVDIHRIVVLEVGAE